MKKQETRFEEQDAPLKNTDKAFVKVNKDGSPGMQSPSTNKKEELDRSTSAGEEDNESSRRMH